MPKQDPHPRKRPLPPFLVLVLSLLATLFAGMYVSRMAETKDRERFRRNSETIRDNVRERMTTYINALRGTAALFSASHEVRGAEFRRYVDALAVRSRYPGIMGIGFAERVPPGEEHAYEARERAARPRFDIRPDGPRAEMTTVRWLQPETGRNAHAVGFDMFSNPVRRRAMERARDTGEPAVSGKVRLLQETQHDPQSGFLIYVPVYRGGIDPASADLRRAALIGWVYSPFRAGDLFRGIGSARARPRLDMEVYAGANVNAANLLHRTAERASSTHRPRYRGTQSLDIAGTPWTLAFSTRADFELDTQAGSVAMVNFGGLVISLLLFVITLAQSRGREAAERAAEELRRSEEALREAAQAKDEFLAMLGHELRNPLAAVANSVALLRYRVGDDPAANRALDAAERQVRHQRRLLDDLLDVSRVTSGKINLRRETVDFRTVVALAIEAQQPAVADRAHTLTADLGRDALWVEGDPFRLEQIVSNLLTNAAKYTPPGGSIEVMTSREANSAVLRVRDTGVGIPREMLTRIFELFTQGTTSAARSEGGLGLGLTLVRALADLHGGSVSAASDGPGKGADFTVHLPLSRPLTRASGAGRESSAAERKSRFVVVVEDNPDARETLRELLELWGHRVETANEGRQGLELILEAQPEIALVDIGLPEMDGMELARRVRAAGISTRLIAVTGYGQPDDRRRSDEAGFDAHLVKPVDLELLAGIVGRS